ncbi:uncharacterized protein E0L32_009006 [Thyridium curvatum]|uniref:Uncharacterized protein n=1 Tax=Thyridium curvatum TaxID=1093900 RepID=A0A507AI84_9PEZI|nr:uncharacterized protein E0L32_009006 [Thyridium curvatum]TPX09815.1 hypothetical protein E0L32_009006 [Thyridium curvatum]
MPRPARTKGVSGRLAARHAASTSESESLPAPAPQAAKDVDAPSSDIYGVSDRELERRRSTRRSSRAAASTTTTTQQQAGALEGAKRRRDEAMDRLGDITSTTSADDAAGHTSDKAASPAVEVGRREQSVASAARTTRRRIPDASGLDVLDDDEMFGDMDTSFDEQDLDSPGGADAHKSHNSTNNTSSFNVALFKRGRPRTSSIVGRDDGPIRPSSRGPNTPSISSTLNLGIFKRRAREPSILGTARKQRARSQSVTSAAQSSAAQSEDEGAFAPDDAGTPLDRSRMRTSASVARSDVDMPSSPAVRSRKRKSTESHASSSKRRAAESEDGEDDDIRDSIELSSPPPSDQIVEPQAAPEIDDSIMAPPASSDSEADSPSLWPSLKSLAKGYKVRRPPSRTQRTPAPEDDNASDISSPPSLTHSPNYAHARRNPRAAARGRHASDRREPSPVTTADLAAMLPRRNRRLRGEEDDAWDLDSDSEAGDAAVAAPAHDDDELSYMDARRARQHHHHQQQKKQVRPLGPSASGAGQSHAAKTGRPARRKYGSACNASDKENNGDGADADADADDSIEVAAASPLPDDTFDSPEDADETTQAELAEELVRAARKFKEVDKWELDFEEVTEVEVSSPSNAR